jgi:hypothetical protein
MYLYTYISYIHIPIFVEGYPTLVLYRRGVRIGSYGGSRKSRDIVAYLKKKLGHVFTPISSLAELEDFNKQIEAKNNLGGGSVAVVLGLFPPGQFQNPLLVYRNFFRTF